MNRLTIGVMILGLLATVGCSPVESKARDTAAALSGSIVAAQGEYQASCAANGDQQVCQLIIKAWPAKMR